MPGSIINSFVCSSFDRPTAYAEQLPHRLPGGDDEIYSASFSPKSAHMWGLLRLLTILGG